MSRSRHSVPFALAALGLLAASLWIAPDADIPVPDVTRPLAGAAATVNGGGAGTAEREAAERRPYDLLPGDQLDLECRMDLISTVAQQQAAPTRLEAGVDGLLELLVVARRDGELALAANMPGASVRGGEGASPAAMLQLRQDLALVTLVRLSPQGSILGYRFPATMPARHRNQFRALFAALRATIATGKAEWTCVEADATGDACVQGAWDASQRTLSSHKTAYRCKPGALVPQVDGHKSLTLDPASGWWRSVDCAETSILVVEQANLEVTVEATVHAELRATRAVPPSSAAFDWDGPWAAASGAGEKDTDAVDPEDLQMARELQGVSIAVVFTRLRDLLAAAATDVELYEARRRLVWLIRHDPRALAELEGLLADVTVSPRLIEEVLGAVGSADFPAGEQFLAGVLGGAGVPATRLSAAQALFQTTAPTAAALQALRTAIADPGAPRELHGTGLLLLGAFAGREGGVASQALQELLAREAFARDEGLVVDWLEALGNAGRSEVTEVALRHFDASDDTERAAAVAAVRKVDDPRLLTALSNRAESDEAALVRSRAVESLAGRAGAGVLPLLERILANDADEQVRGSALLAIAYCADRTTGDRILAQVAGQDPSPRMRQLASDLQTRRRA